ncbi:hypothetical protein BsWGS_00543 [Bradybaena similaris]
MAMLQAEETSNISDANEAGERKAEKNSFLKLKAKKDLNNEKQSSSSVPVQEINVYKLPSTKSMIFHKPSKQANITSSVSISEHYKLDDSSMPDTQAVSHSKHSKNLQKKRGSGKKSHLHAEDNTAESLQKKKCSSGKKAHTSPEDVNMDISAAALAVQLGFEKPHEPITLKSTGNDKDEEVTKQSNPVEIIQQLLDYQKSCKCTCLANLNMRDLASHRMEITLLDRQSRDFFIMGLLRCGAVAVKGAGHRGSHTRNRYSYRLMNTRICQCCFLAVNNIGGKYLKNLKKHFAKHGVTFRLHGNHGRKPHHAINSSDITDVVEFVKRYASTHGVPAARRPKSSRAVHIMRLPLSDNVTSIHKKYKEFYEHSGKRAVALTSFRKIWSDYLPHIKLTFKEYVAAAKNLATSICMQEPGLHVDSNPQHPLLEHVSKTQLGTQDTNMKTQSIEIQTAVSQKSPVNLSYEYSGAELPHSQMVPFNMYGSNRDTLQLDYPFSQTSVPLNHRIQTVMINLTAPTNVNSTNTDITQEQSALGDNEQPSFQATVSTPVGHMVPTDTFTPASDKQIHLFSPNNAHVKNSDHLRMAQFSQKSPSEMYNNTSLTTNSGSDMQQEPPSLHGSGFTILSQHRQMSLFQ